jgi:hypothetical protein
VINKKSLKRKARAKKSAVSFLPPGQCTFKVGYTGRIQDIYDANPNHHLIKIHEEKARKSNSVKRRQRREASYLRKYGAKIQKSYEKPISGT